MKALLSTQAGDGRSLSLSDIPEPLPGPGEVRIAVEACGINYPDVLVIRDLYQFRPERPFAPGAEVAGRIDAVGEGVSRFRPGDRVLSMTGWGGLVEKIVMPEEKCFPIPQSMPAVDAAAFLMTYGTSQHALKDRAALKVGETLLVLGASGGVGLAAVELGKAYGARVIAGVSTEAKAAIVRERGADEVIVYGADALDKAAAKALTARIKDASGGGVDVVYDAIGGSFAEPALRAMAWEGRYLVIGFTAGIASVPLNLPLLKGCAILGVFWGEFTKRNPEGHEKNVAELIRLYEQGQVRPLISERFPLERGGEAIERLAERAAVGKIVVTMTA